MALRKILVADDDTAHAVMLKTLIRDWEYEVMTADDGDVAVEMVKEQSFDLVLMDLKMINMSGMEALARIHDYNPSLPVIIMTAYSSVNTAVKALKIGAYDYLTKPLDFDHLKMTIERLFEQIFLKAENQDLKERLEEKFLEHEIIGKSPAVNALLDTIQMVAPTEANVLVTGESGTGKELVASAIHNNSLRRLKPFIRINCAAITETLLESELFGHERGAFTGAEKSRKGKFQMADQGSILLDEIGEMNLPMQAKLLRVIQEKELSPVGSEKVIQTNVRIIASTNRDLKALSDEGRFRQDLYYRLNVVRIDIPPLRERTEDIPLLATHFLERFAKKNHRQLKGFSPDGMDAMIHQAWEGNVRELMNCVERAVVLARSDYVGPSDLGFAAADPQASQDAADLANVKLAQVEEQAIRATLLAADGNKSEAARRLGITRKTLLKKLKQYEEADSGA